MYRAPTREIRFVLSELLDFERLTSLPAFAEYSTEFATQALEEAADFAESVLAPINRIGDTQGAHLDAEGVRMPAQFKQAYQQFVENGWSQLRGSPEYGGQGAPTMLGTAIEEIWASANLAFKLCPMLTQGAIEAIERCGSAEQRRTYLPKLISGEWTGTMNLTEPQAGSDLGAIRTRAVPDADRYRVYGQKIFITYGDHDLTSNVVHLVLARIEGAPAGTRGLSLFIVPKYLVGASGEIGERNDVRCISLEHKLGIHASPTCVMSYGEADGALGYLVGEQNRGLEYMFIMMNAARLSVGLEGYALGERAYQQALDWARSRVQGVPKGAPAALPIVHHPDVKRMLLKMKSCTDGARALALYAALQLDLGKHGDDAERTLAQARGELLIPIVKAWSTELGIEIASLGIQVHGGMGYIEETGAAQLLRDVRITSIYEGTTGIQAADLVGRKVMRDHGDTMQQLLREWRQELTRLENSDEVRSWTRPAKNAIDELENATEALLRLQQDGPQHALAVSVPYTMLCGTVLSGCLMAKSAAIATDKRSLGDSFYAAKIQIVSAYVQQIVPQAAALADVVRTASMGIVAADPELF
jgi:alkylation response protein AidB-like acyl-CoA dehydrogenase